MDRIRAKLHLLYFVIGSLSILIAECNADSAIAPTAPESRVHDWLVLDLFLRYDPTNIPTRKGVPVDVDVELYLEHLDFLEKHGIFHFVGDLVISWRDAKLAWNPSDYKNITEIPIEFNTVWVPDIEIYNNEPRKFIRTHRNGYLVLSHTGQLIWADTVEANINCSPEMYTWPHDSHTCILRLGSWTFHAFQIKLSTKNSEREKSLLQSVNEKNLEYAVVNHTTVLTTKIYECCEEPYESIDYTLTLQRKAAYAIIFRISATVVIILNLLSLIIEPHCVEKIWLNGVNLIVITLHLLYFAKQLGNLARETPAIVQFFNWCFVLVTLTQLISVFSLMATHARFNGKLPACCSAFLNSPLGNLIANKSNTSQQTVELHPRFEDVQLPKSSKSISKSNTSSEEWTQLAIVIERSALFAISIAYAVVGARCYV